MVDDCPQAGISSESDLLSESLRRVKNLNAMLDERLKASGREG
jgi:hypothetical protein